MSKCQIQLFALPKDTLAETVIPLEECPACACTCTLRAEGIISGLEQTLSHLSKLLNIHWSTPTRGGCGEAEPISQLTEADKGQFQPLPQTT